MNGKAPRRPRESKRRRCAFVVGEECGNVPAPCQTSLKGVRPHSAGVGKPGRDGAHTRRARLQLHRPIRGYMEEEKNEERKKERRKSKEERGSGGLYHAFAFVLWPPPSQSYTPSPPHTNLKWECVRASLRTAHHHRRHLLLRSILVSAWAGVVWGDGGLEPAPSTTCVAPAWRKVDRDAFDGAVFIRHTKASSALYRACRRCDVVLTT